MNNLEQNEFAEYYSPSGVLLGKEIPRVLSMPLQEETSVTPRYPNPQHHIRHGMRGSWIVNCSKCKKELVTTIDLIKPDEPLSRITRKRLKEASADGEIAIINYTRKKIVCTDCGTNPEPRFDDDSYLNYLDTWTNIKKKRFQKNYRHINKDKVSLQIKNWRLKNSEKIKDGRRKWRVENREHINKYNKVYRLKIKGGVVNG